MVFLKKKGVGGRGLAVDGVTVLLGRGVIGVTVLHVNVLSMSC